MYLLSSHPPFIGIPTRGSRRPSPLIGGELPGRGVAPAPAPARAHAQVAMSRSATVDDYAMSDSNHVSREVAWEMNRLRARGQRALCLKRAASH